MPAPTRRDFVRTTATSTAALAALGARAFAQAAPVSPAPKSLPTVRVGFVGVGVKGSAHVGNLLRLPGVELRAVCDIVEAQCVETQRQAERLGLRPPTAYFRGERDYERLCAEEELDLVYTATPWHLHVPVCLAAMKHGKHAATEVPAAYTLEECWALVETVEKTGRHLVQMENVNYQRNELATLRMVRERVLGEIVHCEGAYLHDTRHLKIHDYGDGLWLGDHHATRNGCLYPTHGIGPLAWYTDQNRGDRMDHMVSMSSNARGMDDFVARHLPPGHPKRERRYLNGDVNTCLIKTARGLSLTVKHDTDLPRPYSRINLVQGTRGAVSGYPEYAVCLDGEPEAPRRWQPGAPFLEKYEHPLWRHAVELAAQRPGIAPGQFGPITKAVWDYNPATELRNGDFIEDFRLIHALQQGVPPDFDVYDAASWSAIAVLSEKSVAHRSAAVDFPDFTRGKWKTAAPVTIMGV
jgi:predicted dehydrogenase